MGKVKLSLLRQVGLDFFDYLNTTERASITDRSQLQVIYKDEFKIRITTTKGTGFASVLYALKQSGKITVRDGTIRFNSTVRGHNMDQWHRHRGHHQEVVQDVAACPGPAQILPSLDSAPVESRYQRKLARDLMGKLKTKREHFISDKHGVSITADRQFDNGKLLLCVEDTYEYTVNLTVKNTGEEAVLFTYYTPLYWLKCFTLVDEHKVTRANPLKLNPGKSYEIKVHFRCSFVGFYPTTLAFEFKPDLQSTAFHIVRFIEARCITSLGLELGPVAPYRPLSLPAWTPDNNYTIVDGLRPDGPGHQMLLMAKVDLKQYQIPPYMHKLIKALKQPNFCPDGRVNTAIGVLRNPLNWENYTEKLQLLLYLEELQMEVDIKKYNIPNGDREHATMSRDPINNKLLVLEVPGVSENRPSVIRGDQLLVCPEGEKEKGKKYRGYVHSVQLDRIKLGFNSELRDRFVNGMKFSVEFTVNRLTLRLQYRAAELATEHRLENVLFPAAPVHPSELPEHRKPSLFDRKLEKNPEQYRAVQHIVAGTSKPAPYLVFGPPGTGKTVTLVEAIKQIEKTQSSSHILACAPSNSAADLLCSKIVHQMEKRKVYRMYASSVDPQIVPEVLKDCCNLKGDSFIFPDVNELMGYKIIVTTLFTAGRLVTGNIPVGHFTHVFVDEAGHAEETQCLIPMAGLLDASTGQVVLAGDPKQLGPILRSPFALEYGFGVSLLERLMNDFPVYQKENGVYDSRFVTKLLCNYRSHPDILEIPNEKFYEGELLCCADVMLRNSYCTWEYLPQENFPLIFHAVTGIDEREASSPSFFNTAEVEVLMDYVKKLMQTQGKKGQAKLAPKDIGIIAPYRKQVQKIRKALEKVGRDLRLTDIANLKVGSVEEFQGQERTVILVSTVRSSPNYTEIDKKFNLGFVKNEKRFNVAMTRAKALLIVVGNPRVLKTDDIWCRFIEFCHHRGGYCGPDHAEDDVEAMMVRLAMLCIAVKEAEVETEESDVQRIQDPEWRRNE